MQVLTRSPAFYLSRLRRALHFELRILGGLFCFIFV